jgi:hypothetical protein
MRRLEGGIHLEEETMLTTYCFHVIIDFAIVYVTSPW